MRSQPYIADDVLRVRGLHADLIDGAALRRPVRERLDAMARRLVEAHERGDTAVAVQLSDWAPDRNGHTAAAILEAPLSLAEARAAVAREHGWDDWAAVVRDGAAPPDADLEAAINDVILGRIAVLRAALQRRPELVRARSALGHAATLLHYVAANGVETYRQIVPSNAAAVAQTLLDAGSDPAATMRVDGADCTTLELLETSRYPTRAGVEPGLSKVLRGRGGPPRHRRSRLPGWLPLIRSFRRAMIERLPEADMFATPQERSAAIIAAQMRIERNWWFRIGSPIASIVVIIAAWIGLAVLLPGPNLLALVLGVILGTALVEWAVMACMSHIAASELRRHLTEAGVAVCRACGYDMRSLDPRTSPRCPECGSMCAEPDHANG